MNQTPIILLNMRGGCATVGNTVHTLFRVNGRRPRRTAAPDANDRIAPQLRTRDLSAEIRGAKAEA